MDADLRQALWERSKGYCDACGAGMVANFAAHHRKLRKHGGTDDLRNLLAVHHQCHNGATDSIHLAVHAARMRGHLVSSWDDPAKRPFLLHRKHWVRMNEDGTGFLDGVLCAECGRTHPNPNAAKVCAWDDKSRMDDMTEFETDPEEDDDARDDHAG